MIKIIKATMLITMLAFIDGYIMSYLPEDPYEAWWVIPAAFSILAWTIWVGVTLVIVKTFSIKIKL